MEEVRKILEQIDCTKLTPEGMQVLKNYVSTLGTARFSQPQEEKAPKFKDIEDKLPELKVRNYVLITYLEYLFNSFFENFFCNYDGDLGTANIEDLPNSNKVHVRNSYSATDIADGQYPKVCIEVGVTSSGPQGIGDISGESSESVENGVAVTRVRKWAEAKTNMRIWALDDNYNNCNVVANLCWVALIEARDILRELFNLYEVGYPTLTPARKTREHGKVFAASVDFNISQHIYWSRLINEKIYKRIMLQLRAKLKNDPDEPLIQILGCYGLPLDPALQDLIDHLVK